MYLIYDQQSTRILSREGKRYYQQAAYKTMAAAQAALTRMQKKYLKNNVESTLFFKRTTWTQQGVLSTLLQLQRRTTTVRI